MSDETGLHHRMFQQAGFRERSRGNRKGPGRLSLPVLRQVAPGNPVGRQSTLELRTKGKTL